MLDNLVKSAIETLHITSAIGYAVTGSSILEVVDSQADIDIAIITLNEPRASLSNIINFYNNENDELFEILIEDIFQIKELEDSYGYFSWINYLVPKRQNIIWQNSQENKYKKYQQLLTEFKPFWIHCMIKGYAKTLQNIKEYVKNKTLNKATKKELKELYHLGVTYNDDYPKSSRIELLKKIKRKHLDNLLEEDYYWLLNMIVDREQKYLIKDPAKELLKFRSFKKELDLLWK